LTIYGDGVWASGNMSGNSRTLVAPGATLTLNNSAGIALDGRILENAGTILWTGAGSLILAKTTFITNRPGALFDMRNSTSFGTSELGAKSFENAGTLRKTLSTGSASMGSLTLNNYGNIAIEAGTLTSSSPINSSGSITLSPGTTNRFAGGGSASGTFINPPMAMVEWTSGGTFTLNPGVQLQGSGLYRVSGGPLTLNADVVFQNLDMANMINGSGTLTVSNAMNWTAGNLAGGGRTIIARGATLTIANAVNVGLDNRILENAGTTIWAGAASIILVKTTVITNRPGALFEWRNATSFGTSELGAKSFENAGTLRKSLSTGTASMGTLALNNYGNIETEMGTFTVSSPFSSSGAIILAPGTTNRFSGGGSATGTFTNPPTALVEWLAGGAFALNSGVQLNGGGLYRISGGPVSCG
jgi:hypothetical protein